MKKLVGSALSLLLLVTLALADVKIDGDKKIDVHSLGELNATGDTKDCGFIWFIADKRLKVRKKDGNLIYTGPPGTYDIQLSVINFTSKKIDEANITVTIGPDVPVPPPPNPNPPTPPDDTPLVKTLKTAYASETDAKKKDQIAMLSSLYANWASVITGTEGQKLKTWGELFTAMQAASKIAGLSDKLVTVRKTIATHLLAKFPTDTTKPLDATSRQLAATTFTELSEALKEAGK
jgi:hypothetical protein